MNAENKVRYKDDFYNDVSVIISRLSDRTQQMKKNNLTMFNKFNIEMNNLLIKTQELIRICLVDHSDFLKDVELIQSDFVEVGKKLDERYSNINIPRSTPYEVQNQIKVNRDNPSYLETIINQSIGDEIEEDNNVKVTNKIHIPDTCMNEPKRSSNNINMNNKNLVIRDTIEEVDENSCTKIDDSISNEKELGENFEKRTDIFNKLDTKSKAQSTPLSVRKKLHEFGLCDLTNSPGQINSVMNSNSESTDGVSSPSAIRKNTLSSPAPVKFIQKHFSPILESPLSPKRLSTVTLSPKTSLKTPVKLLQLTTPTKSPANGKSIQQLLTVSNDTTRLENDGQNELDYSFEFREQMEKKNKEKVSISQSSFKMPSQLNKQNNTKKSLTNKKSSQIIKRSPAKLDGVNERSIFDLLSDLSSPNKNQQNAQPSKPKKLKQLTMKQIFTPQTNEQKFPDKSISSSSSNPNLQNSMINNKEISRGSFTRNNSDIASFRVKNEPSTQIEDETQLGTEVEMSDYTDEIDENLTREETERQKQLNEEYFASFDKVPKKKSDSPTYKYLDVVRKHDERKKLGTSACRECETYWNSLPEHMRPKKMDELCRHRAKYQLPSTPEHYWSIGFPTTQECIERGYGGVVAQNDKEDAQKRPRRKRPLKLIANSKDNDDYNDYDINDPE